MKEKNISYKNVLKHLPNYRQSSYKKLENTRGLGKEYNNLHIKSSYKGAVCRAKPKQAKLKLNNFVCVVILEVRNEIVD